MRHVSCGHKLVLVDCLLHGKECEIQKHEEFQKYLNWEGRDYPWTLGFEKDA